MAYRIVTSDNFEVHVVRAQRFLMNSAIVDGLFDRIDSEHDFRKSEGSPPPL